MTIGYGLQALTLNGTVLTGTKSMGIDHRESLIELGAAGTLHRTLVAIKRKAPIVSFQTVAIDELLDVLTNADAPMVNISSNLDMVFAKQNPNAPGFDSSGHIGRRIAAGQVYLNSLRWAKNGDGVEADCTAFAVSADGTTDPVASATIALPTAVPTEVWTVTSVTLGGQAITKTESLEITIGHNAENNKEICYDLGLPYPKMVSPPGAGGMISITGSLETTDQSVAPTGTGTLVVVLSQYANGASVSATTKTITLNGAMIRETGRPAQAGSPATRRFAIDTTYNGTTKPLTLS